MRLIATLILLLASTTLVRAEDAPDWGPWHGAKTAYDAGKFEEAFQELQKTPQENPTYYFNLGTVALKAGRPGVAVAYLEKASRLRPHDPPIQRNLQSARDSLAKRLGQSALDPASTFPEKVADQVALEEVRGAVGLLVFILILIWARSYRKTRRLRQSLLEPGGLLGLSGLAIALGLYGAERYALSRPAAILIEAKEFHTGPAPTYAQIGNAEAGVKVRVLGSAAGDNGEWLQVRFAPDAVGWLPASSLLLL